MRQVGSRCLGLGRQSLPVVGIAAALALAIGGAHYGYQWLTHSSRFAISSVHIEGQEQLTAGDIEALLGLSSDANIFRTDMGSLEDRLMASPWIVSAEVSRDLPSGLDIVIREEHAVAAIELGGLYLVNGEGKLFKRANVAAGDLDGLTIVTGISREQHVQSPEATEEALAQALVALEHFAANKERPRIGELHIDPRHGLSLITFEDAIAIHIGTPESGEFEERYRAFDSAWQALDAEEHAAARSFRIADRTPSDRVTVAFAGN